MPKGVNHWPRYLNAQKQQELLKIVRKAVAEAPLFTPRLPRTGKEMSVRMTNLGNLGWVTDQQHGYRYQDTHPVTGKPWPPMPRMLIDLWSDVSAYGTEPEACLVNFYDSGAKMGMHQDRDEETFDVPVVSISLGDECMFRVGGTARGGKTVGFKLCSGDVMMLSSPSRLAYHGVSRIYPGTSPLLKNGGRINLTLRRVTAPQTQSSLRQTR